MNKGKKKKKNLPLVNTKTKSNLNPKVNKQILEKLEIEVNFVSEK